MTDGRAARALPAAFLNAWHASFSEFLRGPRARAAAGGALAPPGGAGDLDAPHGTTIVAATFPGGVVMAGDRRATMGNVIAQRDIEKVFPADEYSCVGIAGTAGLAVEVVRLFQVELEHYEKIEGTDALAGRQGQPARHPDPRQPRHGHAGPRCGPAVRRVRPRDRTRAGSSPTTSPAAATRSTRSTRSARARCSPAARSRSSTAPTSAESDDVAVCVEALYDAADDDSATGGPDLARASTPSSPS